MGEGHLGQIGLKRRIKAKMEKSKENSGNNLPLMYKFSFHAIKYMKYYDRFT